MSQMCFLPNLTSAEWAAWVQAAGSIIAIVGATWVAIWQSRRQHENSLDVLRNEHRLQRTESALTLLALSTNCLRAIEHFVNQFPDRSAVHRIAEQEAHLDFNELRSVERAVSEIPLHNLPHTLVTLTMTLSATVRQFREKVEAGLRFHREMNSSAFDDFFSSLSEMQSSLALTCKDIEAEVQRSNIEA